MVPRTCDRCSQSFCFACGESSTATHNKVSASLDVDISLFHCANIQGVVLGVGLAMLEKSFLDDTVETVPVKSAGRTSRKRRKPEATAAHHHHHHHHHSSFSMDAFDDDDDDDDAFYPPTVVQGKKPKLGTGYAGDTREDVRPRSPSPRFYMLNIL